MKITDYTHTNNPHSLHIAESKLPFPEWVSAGPIPHKDEMKKLASAAFADQARRLLPVHDKQATFLSAVDYFANVGAYCDRTFDVIKEACEHFGIGEDVAAYAEVFAQEFEKSASEETEEGKFAINTTINGNSYRILPLNNADEITKSARDLASMLTEKRVHYLMFVDAAKEIVKAANGVKEKECEITMPSIVVSAGTPRFEDIEGAEKLIRNRKGLSKVTPEVMEDYENTVKEASTGAITAYDCMQKIAAIDDAIGLDYKFGSLRSVILPHDIVFTGPTYAEVEKMASVNVMIKDVAVPKAAIQQIDIVESEFKLTKQAFQDLKNLRGSDDAADLSLAISRWEEKDKVSLLQLAVAYN